MPLLTIFEIVPDVLPIPLLVPLIVPELLMEVMLVLFDMPTLEEDMVPVFTRLVMTEDPVFLMPYVLPRPLLVMLPFIVKESTVPSFVKAAPPVVAIEIEPLLVTV